MLVEVRYPLSFTLRPGTKNGRTRRVKIQPKLAAELAAQPVGPEGFLFTEADGLHISSDSFRKLVWRPLSAQACPAHSHRGICGGARQPG